MLDEFRKSINSILYERVTSPFWGAYALSWILWNWEIVYVTIFISEDKLNYNKLEYLKRHYDIDIFNSIIIPFIISLVIISIIPLVANGAYWLSLLFKKWKINKKRSVEKTTLLTFKESVEIKEEILKQGERFNKLNTERDSKLIEFEKEIFDLKTKLNASNSLILKKDNKIQELESKILESIDNRDNLMDMFSYEKWIYEVSEKDSFRFELFNQRDIKIGDLYYQINVIHKHKKNDLKVLLLPKDYGKNYSLRYLRIHRSKNLKFFEGEEYLIQHTEENKYIANRNDISIKKV